MPAPGVTALPGRRWLWLPVLALLLVLLLVFWLSLQRLSREHIELEARQLSDNISSAFRLLRNERVDAMRLAMQAFLGMDPQLVPYLQNQERELLMSDYRPGWALLRSTLGVTHFNFILPDRRNLLRMHQPDRFGDLVERNSLLLADREWRTVSDIQYGHGDEVVLRVVQPVFPVIPVPQPEVRAGFLELGITLEDLLIALRERLAPDRAFEYLVAVPGASDAAARGGGGTAEAGSSEAPAILSTGFPRALLPSLMQRLQDTANPWPVDSPVEIRVGGQHWLTTRLDIDAAHPDLILLAAQDISTLRNLIATTTLTAFAGTAALCSLLFAAFYLALRRTNRMLVAQQRRLEQTTERLDLALSVGNDGVWDWNPQSGSIVFDDRYYRLAGYEPGAFPQNYEAFRERIHPEDVAAVEAAIAEHLAGRSNVFQIDFRFLRHDGGYMWLQARGDVVARDADGNALRFIGTHSDISDLKRALAESADSALQLDQRNRLLESINRLGRQVTTAESVEEIGRLTVSVLREQDGAPLIGLFLIDEAQPEYLVLKFYDAARVSEKLFKAAARLSTEHSFNGLALKQERILHCSDFQHDERIHLEVRRAFTRAGARAETILPLISRGRPIGTIAIVYLEPVNYTEEQRWAHNAIAQTVSIALDNLDSRLKLQQRQQIAESINELSVELNRAPNVAALAGRSVSTLEYYHRGAHALFHLSATEANDSQWFAAQTTDPQKIAALKSIASAFIDAAVDLRKVVFTADAQEARHIEESLAESIRDQEVRSVICMPLLHQGVVLGGVSLLYHEVQQLDGSQLLAFESMARTIATALHGAQKTARLSHEARHDSLTGLPNRARLHEHVRELLTQASAPRSLVLLLLDLNRFKEVNDTLGHHIGDELLRAVAERIAPLATANGGTLFRLGGDEFAVVARARDARRIAESVAAALRDRFPIKGMNLELDCSIGGALYPEHGSDSHELLRCADIAMYDAKRSSETFQLYDQQLDDRNPERLEMLGALRVAIGSDTLQLVYQPRIEISSNRVIACEALARWHDETLGNVPPAEFIPLAEMTDLIHLLTPWVIRTALRQLQHWRSAGLEISVSVNVSGRNLLDTAFPNQVERLLEECRVPARCLELEITETALVTDPDRALTVLRTLSGLGISIAIDDFGTGYSSLDYLKRLPLNTLKVDRSFIRDMLDQERDAAIVQSTIGLAHSLGLRVVAEGAEEARVVERLSALSCEEVQGYVFSRPLAPDAFLDWCRAYPEAGHR